MIRKYLVPILGVMSFVSFVAYATAQTKPVAEMQVPEQSSETHANDILSAQKTAQSSEISSADNAVDTSKPPLATKSSQPVFTQSPVVAPQVLPVAEEVNEQPLSPVQFTEDVSDDQLEFEEPHSENSRYEDDDDD